MSSNKRLANLRLLAASLFSLFVLAGCSLSSATAINYDSPAPPEKTCTLNISNVFTVRSFDGRNVEWEADFGDMWAMVRIAEGSHAFVLDYYRAGEGGSSYTAKGIYVAYGGFAAGHTYLLASQPLGGTSIRIGIKDVTNEPDWGSFSKAFNWTDGFEWLPLGSARAAD